MCQTTVDGLFAIACGRVKYEKLQAYSRKL